jgi:hypothetical protein
VPSLREIEQTVATLWLDKEARQWLLSKRKGKPPASLANAAEEILRSVDRKGIELYGNLINFGHQDVMEAVYPYCSKLLAQKWPDIVDDYLRRYPPEHHNFNRLCARFPEYVTKYGGSLLERYPFLPELADYEWIELEKMEEPADIKRFPHSELSDLTQIASLRPVLNPTAIIRRYSYNVLDIGDTIEHEGKLARKVHPDETLVAIYRDPETHRCRFVVLGTASASVVEAARNALSYQQLIPVVVGAMPNSDPQQAVIDFLELVEELQQFGIFVGSAPAG